MDKYNFSLDLDTENSISLIIDMLEKNSIVLEIGPAHGRLTKYMKQVLSCTIDIVELEDKAGIYAKQYARNAFLGKEGDVESNFWYEKLKQEKYDFIILADILEHLREPEKLLNRCKKLLSPKGAILLSVPNLAHTDVILNLLNDQFDYQEIGLLDNTHIHFFTYESLQKIVEKTGLEAIVKKATYCSVGFAGLNTNYNQVSRDLARELKKRRYGEIYQFVWKLQKKEKLSQKQIVLNESYNNCYESKLYLLTNSNIEYSENQVIIFKINPEQEEITLTFDITGYEEIKQIRLDPLNVNCIYKLNNISINKENIKLPILYQNGIEIVDGIQICGTDDPYIICNFPKEKSTKIEVSYTILAYDTKFIEKLEENLKQKRYSKKQLEFEEKTLESQLKEKDIRIGQLDWKVHELERDLGLRKRIIIKITQQLKQNKQQLKEEKIKSIEFQKKDIRIGQLDWKVHELEKYINNLEIKQQELIEENINLKQHWKDIQKLNERINQIKKRSGWTIRKR